LCVFATASASPESIALNLHCDDFSRLRQLCDQHGLWLHIEGDALDLWLCNAKHTVGNNSRRSLSVSSSTCQEDKVEIGDAPSLPTPTLASLALECADSICIQPLHWFGSAAETTLLLIDEKSTRLRRSTVAEPSRTSSLDLSDMGSVPVLGTTYVTYTVFPIVIPMINRTSEMFSMVVALSLSCNTVNSGIAASHLRFCRLLIEQGASTDRNFRIILLPDPNLVQHRLAFHVGLPSRSRRPQFFS
jgi:hypothetical protein